MVLLAAAIRTSGLFTSPSLRKIRENVDGYRNSNHPHTIEATKVMTPMSSHLQGLFMPAARKARTIEGTKRGGRNVDSQPGTGWPAHRENRESRGSRPSQASKHEIATKC